jgi:Mrp family chromosome partitioning ATPase
MLSATQVYQALDRVMDPELGRSLVALGMIHAVEIQAKRVTFELALTTLACPLRDRIMAEARQAVRAVAGGRQVDVALRAMTATERRDLTKSQAASSGAAQALNDLRHVVAVMSGKGGVGKSLVSALLAVALRRQGYQVGVLDADITGPSIPKMFFPHGAQLESSPAALLPAETRTGIKVMSINLLLESEEQPVIWRGPLIGRAIQQFWGDVLWGVVDYLVVDLPPGTSDAPLTVMQSLPLSGVVLVTSPQDLAGMVVSKAAQMAHGLAVPILGLIENMSYFVCSDTGRRYDVFGPSHAEALAARLEVPLLGRLPIDPALAALCDTGDIESYPAEAFLPVVARVAELAPPARVPVGAVGQ